MAAGVCAVVLASACTSDGGVDPSAPERGQPDADDVAIEEVDGVPLGEPAAGFARQCQEAAAALGFAVPCPTRLPLVGGERVGCAGTCVGTTGAESEVQVFVLDVEGYDAVAGAPDAVRHLVVEAFKADEAPPIPCYEGAAAGTAEADGVEVALLDCPPSSVALEANVQHGEGIHAGHLLGYWDSNGVRYAVSVHGVADDSGALLQRLVSSIQLVEPQP
ncbi:MAG TPA: hypothetical protein VKB57_15905 [Acidimicrobiales bacterium]|nr:hypothetical protein [Acidimicrobiales bacterium]